MIAWMLEQMEKIPSYCFSRTELLGRSRSEFNKLRSEGFLEIIHPDEDEMSYPCPVRDCGNGCPMEVERRGKEYYAVCPVDDEVEPLPLTADNIARYRLNLATIIDRFRQVNELAGRPSYLDRRLFYLGETRACGLNLGVILALFGTEMTAVRQLLALPNMLSGRLDRFLVVFPTLEIKEQAALVRLEKFEIYPINLSEEDFFRIDYSPAIRRTAPRPVQVTLTPDEDRQFDLREFKSRLPIEITGEIEKRSSNIILIGGAKVSLGDAPFALFLRLAVELFKGGDGCVSKGDPVFGGGLIAEGILPASGMDQAIQRLREKLAPALQGLPSNQFIEAYRPKHLRLSTHPAYVRYEKGKLLDHAEDKIVTCARYFP